MCNQITMFDAKAFIRTVYLYLFALVGLFVLIFGSIGLIKLAFTTWVFPEADIYSLRDKPLMIDERSEDELIEGLVPNFQPWKRLIIFG